MRVSGDAGPAIGASLSYPASLAFDHFGNLFIAIPTTIGSAPFAARSHKDSGIVPTLPQT
jgi:hypothetical protein